MNRAELGSKIYELSHLEGEFTLSSGRTAPEYFDKYQFLSYPHLLKEVAEGLALLLPADTEILAGVNMGGLPIATALSLYTELPQVFVRKEAKNYGTQKLAEGITIGGRRLAVVEDIITTGRQIVETAIQLRGMDANVEYALGVVEKIDPEGYSAPRSNLAANNISLISLYTSGEIKNYYDHAA